MSGRTVKKKALSDVGQMLAQAKDEFDLTFDKIKDLILEASTLPPFKEDVGLLLYRKLIMGTLKHGKKDREAQKDQIKTHVRPYKAMFEAFKNRIVEEDLEWLLEQEVNIQTGNSKKACLPLSKAYEFCLKKNPDKLDSIEANLYFIFKNVCDGKTQPEHKKKLEDICSQYQVEEDDSAQRAISSIVNRVKTNMPSGGADGKEPSVNDVTSIVQAIVGNGGMQNDMGGLAQGLLSGKLTIPDLIGHVKQTIEASQESQGSRKEEEDSGESYEEEEEDEDVVVIRSDDKGKGEL
jgi:hypothetical protein